MDHDTPQDRNEDDLEGAHSGAEEESGPVVTTSTDGSVSADSDAAKPAVTDEVEPSTAETPTSAPVAGAPAENAGPVDADGAPLEFNWYVLRVQSGREDTCSNALRKKVMLAKMDGFVKEIAVPKQKLTEIKDGKRRIRSQKLYPGYIFIHMALADEVWYLIRDTSGIGDFVGSHQAPTPMPAEEVRKIKSQMEEKEEAPAVKIDLVKNDMVKIKEGPFENFDGVVEEVQAAKGMVRVMVTIFGRATPVDLEYWQVEKL